jgi:hypothetical protein
MAQDCKYVRDKNGVPVKVGQRVRLDLRQSKYTGVLVKVHPDKRMVTKDACIVEVAIENQPDFECPQAISSHSIEAF